MPAGHTDLTLRQVCVRMLTFSIVLALFIGLLAVAHKRRIAWEQQPEQIKAAAAALEQDLKTNLQRHDFIRHSDGRLAIVNAPPNGGDVIELRDCGLREDYPMSVSTLSRQGVTHISKASSEYQRAAAECIGMQ